MGKINVLYGPEEVLAEFPVPEGGVASDNGVSAFLISDVM